MTAVLLYHDVVDPSRQDSVGFPGPLAARYKLDPQRFSAHLDALAATGLRVGVLEEAPAPDITLTFDDAGGSSLAIAEALEERGWRGYFFVPTARIGTAGFLDAEALRALVERGHLVGSHSHTHPTYAGTLSRAELDVEWSASRDVLADLLGHTPRAASVPGGFVSRSVIESAAAAGYRLLFTSDPNRRVQNVGGMTVRGRYAVWSDTPPGRAAACARGDVGPRARLWLEWQAKTSFKRASPHAYQVLRRLRTRI